MENKIPQIGTNEFNDLASACFGGKPKQKTVVEWLKNELNQIKSSSTNMNGTIKFLETEFKELFKQAEKIEKQQQGYSEEEVLELIQFLSDEEDFKENSSISIFIAEDYLNKFKNK